MSFYYFGQALSLSALYMLAGTGAIFSIKNGDFNLGGEGQIYFGGFICALLLNALKNLPPFIAIPITFICVFACGGFIGFISSFLKNKKNADGLFTSFIISCTIIPLIDGLIAGKFRTKQGNLLATEFISQKFRFHSIWQPSSLNGFIFISITLCILTWYFFYFTSLGRKISVKGISSRFSDYSGYNNKNLNHFSFILSSGLHALCGAVTVCGTYYTCHSGFYSGIGWNALSAALIANNNPILLIPSSIVMAFIITYSNKYSLLTNLGFDLSALLQGIILFLIAFPIFSFKKGGQK